MALLVYLCVFTSVFYIIKGDTQAGIRMRLILAKSTVNAEARMAEEVLFVHIVYAEE